MHDSIQVIACQFWLQLFLHYPPDGVLAGPLALQPSSIYPSFNVQQLPLCAPSQTEEGLHIHHPNPHLFCEANSHISSPLAKARPSEFYSTSGDLGFICFDAKNVNRCPLSESFPSLPADKSPGTVYLITS